MNDVRVDPAARRATVGGGAVWADVDNATQPHSLATTGGLVSTTGVAGFTLGGGIGWTMRKFGSRATTWSLPTSSPPTAGSSVQANRRTATCSGGCAAAAATTTASSRSSSSNCTRSGPMVYAGPIFYPADAAHELLHAFRDWADVAPDEITAIVNLTTAPPLPVIPAEWHRARLRRSSPPPAARSTRARVSSARFARSANRSPICSGRCRTRRSRR